MILELAYLDVKVGHENAFETAFAEAKGIIASMPGFVSLELQRCIEVTNRYVLLVRWRTLEDHTVGFRTSPDYQRWKALLHHFYDPFPTVEHYEKRVAISADQFETHMTHSRGSSQDAAEAGTPTLDHRGDTVIVGGCLCRGVRYEYHGEIDEISICHCSQCRKAQGSAFVAVAPIAAEKFKLLRGEHLLKEYRAAPNKARVFCSNCGSPIYSARDDLPDTKRLRLGTVETPVRCSNRYHIYAASKASWHEITDGYPQYAETKTS